MTAWTDILDAALDAEHVLTQETMLALRDNVLALAEGSVGAPNISTKNLGCGGANIDGNVTDPTWTDCGYYEVGNLTFTAPATLPAFSIIRVKGDLTISDVLTVAMPTTAELALAEMFGCLLGNDGTGTGSPATGHEGGGGGIGAGGSLGSAFGGAARPITGLKYFWALRKPFIGGTGHTPITTPNGGGSVIFIVEGDVIATGGTVDASGETASINHRDAGGGGSVIIIATGTLTDGTFKARGGANFNSGGGGGGYVGLVASAFAGSITKDATHNQSSGAAGGDGVSEQVTLTDKEIQAMLIR